MDLPKRAPLEGSRRSSPKPMRPGAATVGDENASPACLLPAGAASPQRKKVLGERNDGGGAGAASSPAPPHAKPAPSPPSLTGRGVGPYNPKTNYTTPRPEFLRYDPERRREMLLRLAREVSDDEDSSSSTSVAAAATEAASSSVSSAPGSDSEAELGDDEEVEVVPARRGGWARRLLLLFVAVACALCFIYCMDPAPFPDHSEDGLDSVGQIGSMYDDAIHEVESLSIYMMGPEDVLEVATSQSVCGDSDKRNFMEVASMGLAYVCPNVPFGELTCQIGDGNSKNVVGLKEDSELDKQGPEVVLVSFHTDDQSTEHCCLGGNVSWNSIGSSSTQTDGEGVYQEESEPQLLSIEKSMESASEKLNDKKDLDNEELDLDTEVWQYENTAEAARVICSKVKFVWSAMKAHFSQIMACLSTAGFVVAMFKYFQRSKKISAPKSQHIPLKPLAEVPVLVPHQVTPSSVSLQPIYSSEQPVQLTGSQNPSISLKDNGVSKTNPFVSLEVPVIGHGKRDHKLQQGDARNQKSSHGNALDHKDSSSSKPAMVNLPGEFTFPDSLRERTIKNLDEHAGDVAVQRPSEALGSNSDNMQNYSSIIQSPTVQRARKQESVVKGEKDATPTPLRRSNRLRSKMTSP
ncbi:hypothetical protein ACP4OV_024992 [Aristida adscensionis]